MSKCSNCPHGQSGCGIEDELCRMFIEAHEAYQDQVVKHSKLLHRFAEDFVNSHYYTDETTAYGKNLHLRDYCILKDILEDRPDLVEKYLAKPGFNVSDFHAMMHEFDTIEPIAATSTSAASETRRKPTITFGCSFNDEQIALLTIVANKTHIFASEVSDADMKALFDVTLKNPLKANSNRLVAVLFGSLVKYDLVNHNWQTVIAQNGLIISSASDKPLSKSAISSALNSASETTAAVKTIKKYVEDVVRLQ